MQEWSLARRLLTLFAFAFGLVLASGAVALFNAAGLRASQAATEQAAERVRLATGIRGLNAQIFAADRAILVAHTLGDPAAVTAWHDRATAAIADGEGQAALLERLVVIDEDRRTAADLARGLRAWKDGCSTCHDPEASIGDQATMQRLSKKTEALVTANAALAASMDESQRRQFAAANAAAERTAATARLTIVALLGISALVGAGVLAVVRRTNRRLAAVAGGLRTGVSAAAASAGQLAGSSRQLSQDATSQAAAIEETSASMEEMAAMTRQNAESSRQAASLMTSVDAQVRDSGRTLGAMVASMAAIQESSRNVSRIMRTIDEIAFQTNILALNAAVEAARAGQAGMGFAVVADEVRTLAQRSAAAAKDTATLIEDAIGRTRDGAATVEHASAAVAGIAESVARVKGLVDEVSAASDQQAQGIAQVSRAVVEMEQVTQRAAATAEESAAIATELNAQAAASMQIVQQLDRLAGRSTPTSPTASLDAPHAVPSPETSHIDDVALRPTGTSQY